VEKQAEVMEKFLSIRVEVDLKLMMASRVCFRCSKIT